MSRSLTGLAYVVVVIFGNSIATGNSDIDRHASGAVVLADMRAHDGAAFWIGSALEVVALSVLLPMFVVFVSRLLSRPWSRIALIAGLGTVVVKVATAVPTIVATAFSGSMEPDTAKLIFDVGGWGFVASWLGTGAFVAAAGIGAMRAGLLPRPLGLAGPVIAGVIVAGTAAGVDPGVPGFLLALLWIAIVSVVLAQGRVYSVSIAPSAAGAIQR